MALKIKLRPEERVFINGALLRNGGTAVELEVLNRVPLLREKDILLEADADTPCKRLYLLLQTLYFEPPNALEYYRHFSKLSMEVLRAAPSMGSFLEKVHLLVEEGELYRALRELKSLLDYESQLMENAQQSQ